MSMLLFGAGGQVGSALVAAAPRDLIALRHSDCDIRDRAMVVSAVGRHRPSLVINAAAYTAVDAAEADAAEAFAVNREGARHVAEAAAAIGAPIVHLSSDYVYGDLSRAPHREDEAPAPLNIYGAAKAAGDAAVASANRAHILLRTSWVFDAFGNNFVRTVLRLGKERSLLRIVDDQIGGPTAAEDIAAAILRIAASCREKRFNDWGIYHFSGAPAVSWCGFAQAIVAQAGMTATTAPIASADYPRPARRPQNSVLDCSKIAAIFGIAQPDWRSALARVLRVDRDVATRIFEAPPARDR
jgi:dTDP-4-dehydrorhamnose reductase